MSLRGPPGDSGGRALESTSLADGSPITRFWVMVTADSGHVGAGRPLRSPDAHGPARLGTSDSTARTRWCCRGPPEFRPRAPPTASTWRRSSCSTSRGRTHWPPRRAGSLDLALRGAVSLPVILGIWAGSIWWGSGSRIERSTPHGRCPSDWARTLRTVFRTEKIDNDPSRPFAARVPPLSRQRCRERRRRHRWCGGLLPPTRRWASAPSFPARAITSGPG